MTFIDVDEALVSLAQRIGFECIGRLSTSMLEVRDEVRNMCASNLCRSYNANWTCPPACGNLDRFREDLAGREIAVIVQTVACLEDEFDIDTILKAEQLHKKRFNTLVFIARQRFEKSGHGGMLALGAGACTICKICTCPKSPCRHPSRAFSSMEAAGLLVSSVCQAAGIAYNHGVQTISYTSCVVV